MTTLNEVAKLAGVSMGTASQALNNKPNVSIETRTRVIEAADVLGYNYDRSLHLGKSSISVVGMLIKHEAGHPIEPNQFYSHVQVGIDEECRVRGLSLMFSYLEVDEHNQPIIWPTMLREQQVDGLIIVGAFLPENSPAIRELDIPIILVDGYAPDYPYDSIVIDNKGGSASLAHHLVAQGHRCFGIIGSEPDSFPSIQERRTVFAQTLQARL
jgi:LacI family transcriptional regulator